MDEKKNVTEDFGLLHEFILQNLASENFNKVNIGLKSQDSEEQETSSEGSEEQ